MPIKVVITDDHPMVVDGLVNAVRDNPDIEVIGTFGRGMDLLEGLTDLQPDVLLLDIQLPDKPGNELVPILTREYPDIKIIILSSMESSLYAKNMIKQGCMGYMLKGNTNQDVLVDAIKHVYNDELYIDTSMKDELLYGALKLKKQTPSGSAPKLTHREKEILQLIVAEYSNREIADKLFLSLRTVENHRYNLLQKLGAKNTVSLVKAALDMNLIKK